MRKILLKSLVFLSISVGPLLSCGTVTEDLGLPPYYGESDLASPAYGWWGLRSFGNSQVGTDIADILCVPISTGSSIAVTVGSTGAGDFDVTSLTTACDPGSYTYSITKLYDQSGYGFDLTPPPSLATPPQLKLNCIGSLPCMLFDGATSQLTASIVQTYAQPITLTAVATYTDPTSTPPTNNAAIIGNDPSANASMMLTNLNGALVASMTSNNTATLDSGGFAVNSYHFVAAIFSGTTSSLYVDNSLISTGDAGANGLGPQLSVGASGTSPVSNYLKGQVFEIGVWPFAFSPLQVSTFTTSATNYWGFN